MQMSRSELGWIRQLNGHKKALLRLGDSGAGRSGVLLGKVLLLYLTALGRNLLCGS